MDQSYSNTINNNNNQNNYDDEFPFYDCIDCPLDPIDQSNKPRRRPTFSHHDSATISEVSSSNSSVSPEINVTNIRKFKSLRNLDGNEGEFEESVFCTKTNDTNTANTGEKIISLRNSCQNEGESEESRCFPEINDTKIASTSKKFESLGSSSRNEEESGFCPELNDTNIASTARKFDSLGNSSRNEGEFDECGFNNDQVCSSRENHSLNEESRPDSVITDDDNNEGLDHELNAVNSNTRVEEEELSSNFLIYLAGLVIKAIGFQLTLLVRLITFPIWLVYSLYMFVTDPFGIKRCCVECCMGILVRISGAIYGSVSPLVYEWFRENKWLWKLGVQLAWGLLWSVCVCIVLSCLLVSAFLGSGLVMRVLVKEPIQMKETLNFDYTKNSPVAYVPILSCKAVDCDVNCKEKSVSRKIVEAQILPPNQNLHITVSLTLPESEYNRNLGVFQVRVDLLSADGSTLSSLRHHSMMQFRSDPIRLLLTFLNIAPLLTGYYSETQTLNINFRGLIEGDTPTACLRVAIEQRAEFRAGAGLPEVYAASITLESGLPFLNWILWYWKKTIFIWLSMTLFTIEVLFALVCCKPLIFPRSKVSSSSNSTNRNHSASQDVSPVQR